MKYALVALAVFLFAEAVICIIGWRLYKREQQKLEAARSQNTKLAETIIAKHPHIDIEV